MLNCLITPKHFDIVTDLKYVPKPNTICYAYKPTGNLTEEQEQINKENLRIYIKDVLAKGAKDSVAVSGFLTSFPTDNIRIQHLNTNERDDLADRKINVIRPNFDSNGIMLWGQSVVVESPVDLPMAMLMFGVMERLSSETRGFDFKCPYMIDSFTNHIQSFLSQLDYYRISVELYSVPSVYQNQIKFFLTFRWLNITQYMIFKVIVEKDTISVEIENPDLAELYLNCFHKHTER